MMERVGWQTRFAEALLAAGPEPALAPQLELYGQFVGTWMTETREWRADGSVESSAWDVRFAWVLEGRAIQDVWMTPPPGTRAGEGGVTPRYGTTFRVYDPAIDAWRILWINPRGGAVERQIGRRVGDEIVQTGETAAADGTLTRWGFRDIAAERFTWFHERSADGGRSWRLVQEMRARRTGAG